MQEYQLQIGEINIDGSSNNNSDIFDIRIILQAAKVANNIDILAVTLIDIDSIEKITREVTQLTDAGVQFTSDAPQYFYSRLPALKVDLLAKASKDAYDRANAIAKNSNSSVKRLRKATMGVFQVTGQNSNEAYTATGTLNTVSKTKTASIIVRMEYELP